MTPIYLEHHNIVLQLLFVEQDNVASVFDEGKEKKHGTVVFV